MTLNCRSGWLDRRNFTVPLTTAIVKKNKNQSFEKFGLSMTLFLLIEKKGMENTFECFKNVDKLHGNCSGTENSSKGHEHEGIKA